MKQTDVDQFRKDLRTTAQVVKDVVDDQFPAVDDDEREQHALNILRSVSSMVFRQSLEETGATHPGEEYSNI